MKTKQLIKYCKKTFDWWLTQLGLKWWKVTILYIDDIDTIHSHFSEDVVMKCWADWRYMTATIEVNLLKLRTLESKQEIESVIVHELCHILVNEMREDGIDHEERVVTTLQKAFMWIRDSEIAS